jgi:hypothetical protein
LEGSEKVEQLRAVICLHDLPSQGKHRREDFWWLCLDQCVKWFDLIWFCGANQIKSTKTRANQNQNQIKS